MTDYTTHLDSIFDPDKPNLGATHLEARDNLIAVTEGGPNAPAIQFAALGRLSAGDELRSTATLSIPDGTAGFVSGLTWHVMQIGSVRVVLNATSIAVPSLRVLRTRAGSSVVLGSENGSGTLTLDVDVIHGDLLEMQGQRGAPTGAHDFTSEIRIAGGNLWAGSAMPLLGNNNV